MNADRHTHKLNNREDRVLRGQLLPIYVKLVLTIQRVLIILKHHELYSYFNDIFTLIIMLFWYYLAFWVTHEKTP